MVVNIYDTANEMSRQLVETQEYQNLKKAFDALKADEDAFTSFKKFQQMQVEGQKPSDDEIKAIQTIAQEISGKKAVQDLMNQERQVDQMLQQVNKTITAPLQSLYSEIMPDDAANK